MSNQFTSATRPMRLTLKQGLCDNSKTYISISGTWIIILSR